MNELERELSRLSNLKQHKGLAQEELEPLAKINLSVRDFKRNKLFDKNDEQTLAEERFRKYLTNNELESDSDLDTLRSLVFNEIFEQRIQTELNKISADGKYPSDKLIKSLVDVQNQKNGLKIKLGIDRKDEEKDELSAYQLLHKRVDKYINEHKNEFSFNLGFQCESCGHKNWESFLLYKRIKDFDSAIKNPWFLGRWLFNYELIKDVKEKKISPVDATRYLMCCGNGDFYQPQDEDKKWCTDYVNYCVENWAEIIDLMNKK